MDKLKTLTPEVKELICHQGAARPCIGQFDTFDGIGTYLCRRCGVALFRSTHPFSSSWPCFDEELPNAIKRLPDKGDHRVEICCQRCDAHLGHAFLRTGQTNAIPCHYVHALSVDFIKNNMNVTETEEAIYAGGCFWGVQYFIEQEPGVLLVETGYTGGHLDNPSYEQVCTQQTGHFEAVRIVYDPNIISYEALTKAFLEIHDPAQTDGQGTDIGPQYCSAIFCYGSDQPKIVEQLLGILRQIGLGIATEVKPVDVFWPAEENHQHYYTKSGGNPRCHHRVTRFEAAPTSPDKQTSFA